MGETMGKSSTFNRSGPAMPGLTCINSGAKGTRTPVSFPINDQVSEVTPAQRRRSTAVSRRVTTFHDRIYHPADDTVITQSTHGRCLR
jgi:hypothetical protein